MNLLLGSIGYILNMGFCRLSATFSGNLNWNDNHFLKYCKNVIIYYYFEEKMLTMCDWWEDLLFSMYFQKKPV